MPLLAAFPIPSRPPSLQNLQHFPPLPSWTAPSVSTCHSNSTSLPQFTAQNPGHSQVSSGFLRLIPSMRLSVREVDKLRLHAAGALAQKRLARGLKLNYPEAVAVIATQVLEYIRDGKSVAELMDLGKQLLGRRNVLPAVPVLLDVVQVEGTFADGTKLVTVHHPICREDGDLSLALHGSFLPVPSPDLFATPVTTSALGGSAAPGQIIAAETGPLLLNAGRAAVQLSVSSRCDRPIQVGSHYHFVETNPLLFFDRQLAYGYHLNILPGTAVRFEPGETKQVVLVAMRGKKRAIQAWREKAGGAGGDGGQEGDSGGQRDSEGVARGVGGDEGATAGAAGAG
ncbi:unnamed protein product [Closterium sp. NIES-64]|nr:unnamed protein product [Closterium sp. NIES-64]